jgi:hypothetical protein
MKFFSYHPCDCPALRLHETAESAKARAEKDLDQERFEAQEGWSQEVMDNPICWGKISEIMTQTERRKPRADEKANGIDEVLNYQLKSP